MHFCCLHDLVSKFTPLKTLGITNNTSGRHNDSSVARPPRYLRHRTLPLSISALKESHSKNKAERWEHLWRTSPLCSPSGSRSRLSLAALTPTLAHTSSLVALTLILTCCPHSGSRSSFSFIHLNTRGPIPVPVLLPTLTFSNVPSSNSANFPKRLTSFYIFLRTGHAPLNEPYIYKSQPALVIQDNNLGSSTFGPKDMLPHQIWALEPLSATRTNSPNLPLVHLVDVTSEVVFVEVRRTPVPSAFYFALGLARLHNGNRQFCVGSG